jgi:hypothetical protein
MSKYTSLLFFLIYIYIIISLAEWLSHYYLMHYNGFLKNVLQFFNCKIDNTHIDHHKETLLDLSLPDDYTEEGLIFNLFEPKVIFLIISLFVCMWLFWLYFPEFKKHFSLIFVLCFSIIIINVYVNVWSSIHSNYHKRYIEVNKPLKNNSTTTIYSLLPYFTPNESSPIYKYLLWYHAIHHYNKGENKGNYGIIFPLVDFIFGTYKFTIDNTTYFAKNEPTNERERWLKEHIRFDLRVLDDNVLEYMDELSFEWKKLPTI